jgi:glycosyltransferase involved in cell wall biosynthesis
MMSTTTLVVPCYNEAERLDVAAFTAFARSNPDTNVILVNDGSLDTTLAVLNDIRSVAPDRISVYDLERNSGKAEAVRLGMLRALETDTQLIGFWDADLATPFDALPAFVTLLQTRPDLEMVIGSRVRLLGRFIERRAARHYAGRAFATAASLTLQLPVYDTQCGAKVFRASPRLKRVLQTPFLSKWVFDVEIIARYGALSSRYAPGKLRDTIYEHPLLEWKDVKGSKLRTRDFVKAGLDLVRIYNACIRPRRSPDFLAASAGEPTSTSDAGRERNA